MWKVASKCDHTSSTATAESLSDWKEMTDKNSGKFFYNVKTRKTQWEKPAEFETSGRTKKTSNAGISSSETIDKMQQKRQKAKVPQQKKRQQRLIQQVTGSLAQTQIHSGIFQ